MEPIMSKPKYVARKIDDLKDMLEQTVALHSDKDAFIKKAKDVYVGVNYKKYKEDVFGLGTELLKRNVKGETVVLLSENRYEWCVGFMATVCGEGIIVPILGELDEDEIVSRMNSVHAKFIMFSENYRELVRDIKKKCPSLEYTIDMDTIIEDNENLSLLRLIELGSKAMASGENDFAKFEVNKEAIAGIFYGDTIVKDRGVMLSHKNLASSIMSMASVFNINENDKVSAFLPFSDISQCISSFLLINNQGATVSFSEINKSISDSLNDTNPTIVFLSNELIERLYNEIWTDIGGMPSIRKARILMFVSLIFLKFNIDLRSKIFSDMLKNFGKNLNLVVLISKKVKNKILRDFWNFGIKTVYCYDLVEAASVIMMSNRIEFVRENIMGMPLPGFKGLISLNGEKSTSEITLKGDSVMVGYYDDKKATKKVLKDGVLYTGRTGYRDKKGCFYYGVSKFRR